MIITNYELVSIILMNNYEGRNIYTVNVVILYIILIL